MTKVTSASMGSSRNKRRPLSADLEFALAKEHMTESQTKLIERTRKAAEVHRSVAAECDREGLPILAREHYYVAKMLEEKITLQLRAFRDGTLVPEQSSNPVTPAGPQKLEPLKGVD